MTDVFLHNGSFTQTPEHEFAVSFWRIPGGTDYEHAEVQVAFFVQESDARAFEQHYAMPPEMASLMTIVDYTKIQAQTKALVPAG